MRDVHHRRELRLLPWLLAAAILGSCTSQERRLRWEIAFGTPALAARAVFVEGRILEGGCTSSSVRYTAETTRTGTPTMPPRLEPGHYGFAARARDASCSWYAATCVDVDVPRDDGAVIVLTLEALAPEESACAAAMCSMGVCGGGSDGGTDVDAGADAGRDGGGVCSIDADCGDCLRCMTGSCVPATDGTMCTAGTCHGGACCTGCFDGTSCAPGTEVTACGAGGADCAACSAPTAFCDAACVGPRVVESYAVGGSFVCAIATDSTLWCWGSNLAGQLGNGTVGAGAESDVPIRVGTEATWAMVGTGDEHVCAVKDDASLWCWGDNEDGQIGTGDMVARSSPSRVLVTGDWAYVDGGLIGDHTCLLEGDGSLHCMGQNDYGELGLGDVLDRAMPAVVPGVYTAIALSHHGTCGLRAGSLYCWGENLHGDLGNGMSGAGMNRTAPGQVGTATDWTAVEMGEHHVCGVRGGGQLWCWGYDVAGQVGNGLTADVLMPLQIGTATTWQSLAAGLAHTCAIRTDGTLWCWGRNLTGQLGIGGTATTDVRAPMQVGSETDWISVHAGGAFTCGMRAGGHLWCWGDAMLGQLGQGDRMLRRAPVEVVIPRP